MQDETICYLWICIYTCQRFHTKVIKTVAFGEKECRMEKSIEIDGTSKFLYPSIV